MINQEKIVEFFDRLARQWDADMIRNDEVINKILDNANVTEGKSVLDVACGTGVLIPDYLERKVSSVTAIDISREMVKIASSKYDRDNIKFICGDVMEEEFAVQYDCIILYNAFPHFPEPEKLVGKLSSFLKPEGTLTIAHGMSKHDIDCIHENGASEVSLKLMESEELAEIMNRYLEVKTVISDDKMYQVVGMRSN